MKPALRSEKEKGQRRMSSMEQVFLILILAGGFWKTEAITVEGELGGNVTITCSHAYAEINVKYFCKAPCRNEDVLIKSSEISKGRYSITDEGNTFYVTISRLTEGDAGTYWCGIDRSVKDTFQEVILTVIKELNISLFLTAAMCVAAILFVCLFTLCLLCVVKHQRSGPRQNRESSADYETMTPGEGTEPEPHCTCSSSDCAASSAPPLPPPDLCPNSTSKHRESTVSLGEYAEVDVRGHVSQYQHLDLSQLEDHVYHALCCPEDGPMQMNC